MCYVVVEECVVKGGGRGRHIDTNCRTQGMPRCQLKYPERNRQRAIQLIHQTWTKQRIQSLADASVNIRDQDEMYLFIIEHFSDFNWFN